MEQELFFTGYCRNQDQSRMVTVILERGRLEEADCCFENCPYAPNCPIGEKIREAISE